ncbi:MAG: N-acetylmuramoyl-L-alanine amidase [Defluviitaleaceae bacterium]|nr:N-acetylmuramoyl-L-alanine amidase [Defluviitaleaceae bacterium]
MPRIAVYAGHGGSDPGAVANGLREKDFNLAISNNVSNILRGWGYQVINNRTTDVNRDIIRDADLANESRVDALAEIHLNSNPGTPATGSEVFYSIRDTGKGRQLASAILRRLVALGFRDRGVKTMVNTNGQDTFGIIRRTNMPAVLVEVAFINNPEDMARLDVGRVSLAIAEGIREAFPISSGGLPPYPGTALRIGARGESVRQIQRCLNNISARQPSIQRLVEDGNFGPRTLDAITTFQRIFGLIPDGIVGPLTWAAISRECSGGSNVGGLPPYPGVALRIGDRGESVRQVQRCLNNISARQPSIQRLVEDGIFGPRTLDAVTTFQRIFGLVPDGVVGPITWGRLTQECPAGPRLRNIESDLPIQNSKKGMNDLLTYLILSNVIMNIQR